MIPTLSRLGFPHQRSTFILLLLLLYSALPAAANTYYDPTPGSCQIIGDQDVYGQGIRLSYYLQWAAVLFGIWIAPESTGRTRTVTNIVTLSIFVNSLRGAIVEDSLMVVEWYIVQYLVFWLLVFNLPTSLRALKSSVGSLVVLLINYCVVVSFPIWLYWRGVDRGSKEGCEPNIFLFASIGAYNPKWIIASKAISTIGAAFLWIPLLGAGWLLILGFTRWADEGKGDESSLSKLYQGIFTYALCANGATAIAFVELTIQNNQIIFPNVNLTDSGQLVPLLIGALTLASVFWEGLKNWADPTDE